MATQFMPEPIPPVLPAMQVLQQAEQPASSVAIANGVARLSLGPTAAPTTSYSSGPVGQVTAAPAETVASGSLSPGTAQGPIRIMSRASASPVTPSQSPLPRSGSSSTAALTFEEREAAYQEARMRIFNQTQAAKVAADQEAVNATPHAANATLPLTGFNMEIQHPGFYTHDGNTLRPSAPSFVYQQPYQPHYQPAQMQDPSQSYGYYAMPAHFAGYGGHGPPVQVNSAEWGVNSAGTSPYGTESSQPYYAMPPPGPSLYASSSNASRPPTRPPSARRSSVSSMSNVSQSSVRTASTSSAQRSTSSKKAVGFDSRSTRQSASALSHPPGRQTRPTPTSLNTSSNSSASAERSGTERSAPDLSPDAQSSTHTSSGVGSEERQARRESWKGKEREITPLREAHPSLPSKPSWLPNRKSSDSEAAQTSTSPVGTPAATGGLDSERDDAEILATEALEAGESPPALTPPAAPSSAASDAGSSIAPSESASQVHAKVAKPQAKIVEYPPLRYDPKRGWTTLEGGHSVASPVLSNQAASGHTGRQNTVKQSKNHSHNSRRGHQHQLQTSHLQQHDQQQGFRPVPVQMQQAVYAQQPPPGYTLQYVAMPTVPGQAIPPQPQYYYPQPFLPPGSAPYPEPQAAQAMPLPSGYQYVPVPVQPGQPAFYPQSPPMQQQVYQYNGQPMQMMPLQPYPVGGMTAADIINSGEMLYSHDIPRPVPRSGATLFDPNKGNSSTAV